MIARGQRSYYDDQGRSCSDGKASKNTLAFKATLGDGNLSGEQLRLWVDRQGPENAVVFKADKKLVGADAG